MWQEGMVVSSIRKTQIFKYQTASLVEIQLAVPEVIAMEALSGFRVE